MDISREKILKSFKDLAKEIKTTETSSNYWKHEDEILQKSIKIREIESNAIQMTEQKLHKAYSL